MTDEDIVKAVRSGTHTLVPMPTGERKWYVGHYANADIAPDALVLILDLFDEHFEGEEMCGLMMGELTQEAADIRAGWADADAHDDRPF